ncbi:hypothetical protein ABPG72_010490 [Tetrahymena utriculariae]
MDQEDLQQQASERIIDLTKAISGIEGKRLQSIAFKIYNARKEAWERVKNRKTEANKKAIHTELQKHLEEFLDKKKEEKKIDIEQIQIFKNKDQYTKQAPQVEFHKIEDKINIIRGLPQDICKLKQLFEQNEDLED